MPSLCLYKGIPCTTIQKGKEKVILTYSSSEVCTIKNKVEFAEKKALNIWNQVFWVSLPNVLVIDIKVTTITMCS